MPAFRRRRHMPKTEEQKRLDRAGRRKRQAENKRRRRDLPGSTYPYPPTPIEKVDRLSEDAWKCFEYFVSNATETGTVHARQFRLRNTGFTKDQSRALKRELIGAGLITFFSDVPTRQVYYRIVPPDETAQRKAA